MAAVAVQRLRIAAPAGRAAETRQRSEDALRLAAGDEHRLLVLRQLVLGPHPAGANASVWSSRAAAALAEQRRGAVYGASPGAEQAGAVWFHSLDDARAQLLRLLAAGRLPSAWFWKLAVPDWRGKPAEQWLRALLRQSRGDAPALLALARFAVTAIADGRAGTLVRWLDTAAEPPVERQTSIDAGLVPRATRLNGAPTASALAGAVRARALMARLDPRVAATVRAIAAASAHSAVSRVWLVRLALVAAAPELAGGSMLEDLVHAELEAEQGGFAPGRPVEQAGAAPPVADGSPAIGQTVAPTAEVERPLDRAVVENAFDPAPLATDSTILAASNTQPVASPSVSGRELASTAAGALLVIRPLWRMGLAEWLAARPALLGDGFGRALLAHCAARMRVPPDEPLFAMLGAHEPADPALLEAWRIGLDRWLRRTARIKLAHVVRKRGWLMLRADALEVRLPVAAADVRLRRRALDLDPGWVAWLGLTVRYHYRDEPLA